MKKGFAKLRESYGKAARIVVRAAGSLPAATIAVLTVITWFIGGFIGSFSDQYQLIINTGTTIVNFILAFFILYTQNQESEALHIKIDALITAIKKADNRFIGIENLSEDDLKALHEKLMRFRTSDTSED